MDEPAERALSPLAMAVLELLHERSMHPYEIQQTMRERQTAERRIVKVRVGSLYHTIERLERFALVEAVETTREGRRPERTVYRITDAGREAFADRLTRMVALSADEYPEFLMAVAFLHQLDQELAVQKLRVRRTHLAGELATLRAVSSCLADDVSERMYWLDVDYRVAMREAELAWVTETLDRIEDGDLRWPASSPALSPGGGPDTTPEDER
ncbi:PadR family transcriptional regulator [Streptoalloteichus hindustanus]|uniref:Transcriptional regulator, PadR family n=1 Tax=Streptoalloteichus hindustanus TaxID=2017 RepID=A0A1M5K6L7_STRHI|nr:PadR family transcriptional regulator [Streptoalloteichus hindustanus]SHG48462.1 transcriptional regulator, PadR family [Streptoalloteichus hindustanus]